MGIDFIPVAVTNFLCVVNKLFVMYFLEILKLPLHWNIFHTVAIYKSGLRIRLLTHHFYFFLSICFEGFFYTYEFWPLKFSLERSCGWMLKF